MKPRLLFFVFLLAKGLHAQPHDSLYVHLQSLTINHTEIINDSILYCYGTSGSSSSSMAYLSEFNLNSLQWRHKSGFPHFGSTVVSSLFTDSNTALLVTINGQVHRTTNGGQSFTQLSIPFSTTQAQTFLELQKVHNGFLLRYRLSSQFHFYHSVDGITWTYSGSLNGTTQNFSMGPSAIGDTLFYINIGNAILYTLDGGQSFPTNQSTGRSVPANTVFFKAITSNLMFAWNSNELRRSSDGGQNWTLVTLPTAPGFSSGLQRIHFKNAQEGLFNFNAHGGFYTNDGGATLSAIPAPPASTNANHYRFVGNRIMSNLSLFASYTTNLGQSWQNLQRIDVGEILDLTFSGNFGILVGEDGQYMLTNNGGYWFTKASNTVSSSDNFTCHFVHDSLLLIGTNAGGVFRSTDQGASFSSGNIPGFGAVLKLKSLPTGQVIAQKGLGSQYSTNFGQGFTTFTASQNITTVFALKPGASVIGALQQASSIRVSELPFPITLSSSPVVLQDIANNNDTALEISMVDAQNGYLLAQNGTQNLILYKTTNGGGNWTRQAGITAPHMPSSITQATRVKMQTFGPLGIAVGFYSFSGSNASYRQVFTSINGGATWTTTNINPLFNSQFATRSVHFISPSRYMIGSTNDLLLLNGFAGDGNSPSSVFEPKSRALLPLKLYPNPSNGYFTVSLGEQQNARLLIYNMQGKLLLEQDIEDTESQIKTHLPAGMYWVRAFDKQSQLLGQSKLVVQ